MSAQASMFCPFCGNPAAFIDSAAIYKGRSYGMVYACLPCDAYVGVHKGTANPLGTLANAPLRKLRNQCHRMFDPLWKGHGGMKRSEAYRWMQRVMNLGPATGHIAMFDEDRCRELIGHLERQLAS